MTIESNRPRERQVRQLSRLVEDLLDAARILQGTMELRRERLPLYDVLDSAVSVVQPSMREREQHLTVHGGDIPLWVDGDPARLQQIFSNLLTNASKFTARGGTIDAIVQSTDDTAIVRIRDTGRGISPGMLPRVFELFTQAERDGRGLGIGLAVVRGLVQAHGGTVEARSDGLGLGSGSSCGCPPRRSRIRSRSAELRRTCSRDQNARLRSTCHGGRPHRKNSQRATPKGTAFAALPVRMRDAHRHVRGGSG